MKTNHLTHGLAVLTRTSGHEPVAALNYALQAIDSDNTNRIQILPAGLFKPADGRDMDTATGQWLMDETAFAQLKAAASTRSNDYHFDYEHQTLYSEENGQPAPAAGWFKDFEFVPGEGLYALNVEWTPAAAKNIANKEYRYTSAVFAYDKATGRPTKLLHVALTNDPAVDGMKAIQALKSKTNLSTSDGETPMNEALKVLFGLLGVNTDNVDFADPAALKAVQDKAKTAIAALKAKADQSGTLEQELNTAQQTVVALKAQGNGEVDLDEHVPKAVYDQALEQIAALTADNSKQAVNQVLADNKNKILATETDYLTDYGNQKGVAALKTLLSKRPEIAALSSNQTHDKPPEKKGGESDLSEEDKYTADQLGISYAAFKKQKESK